MSKGFQSYQQFSDFVIENGYNMYDLKELKDAHASESILFLVDQYLNDEDSLKEIIRNSQDAYSLNKLVDPKSNINLTSMILAKCLEECPVSSIENARLFIDKFNFSPEELEASSVSLLARAAIMTVIDPKKVIDNDWGKGINQMYSVEELYPFMSDMNFVLTILPVNPTFFVQKVLFSDKDDIIDTYLQAMMTVNSATLENFFDAVASINNNQIKGKLVFNNGNYEFYFENELQKTVFNIFELHKSMKIADSDGVYTEQMLETPELQAELLFRGSMIEADLATSELTTLESVKSSIYSFLSTSMATIGKIASHPATKVAVVAVAFAGFASDTFAGTEGIVSEEDIVRTLKKTSKAWEMKGFEHGKAFKQYDAELERIGADLNDLNLGRMDHRIVRFYGEEGDYTFKIGDVNVKFEHNDDGQYEAVIKGYQGSHSTRGIISIEDLQSWSKNIRNNLNKAVAAAESED